ncbi:MAG TPA: hypothetical protein VF526_21630 [Solirubrobacteraceae bacterium]
MLALPALGEAAPVRVSLRIEGKSKTLYEGPITTDTRTFPVGGIEHKCDGTNAGASLTAGPTRGAAFAQAAGDPATGFPFTATWSDQFEDVTFSSIAGEDVGFDPVSQAFLAEFRNGVGSRVGSCQEKISEGDEVLYAYAPFGSVVLKLTGPSAAKPGEPVTLKVIDAEKATAVAGATVGGQTTGADGTAQVTLNATGQASFKATKMGAIRSNSLVVCATGGSDGACGTSVPAAAPNEAATPSCLTSGRDGRCGSRDTSAPSIRILGIANGKRFARGKGPRRIRAVVNEDPSGLLATKLRLTRTDRGRCTYFSGRSERFKRVRCGTAVGWFRVGDQPQIDYLLPSALPRGRYVLDVNAIDKAYNRDDLRRRGVNRIVFYVR